MKIENVFNSKTINLIGRDKEIKQFIYALLTKEHLLLMGPAGTGKSQFANNVFSIIKGSKIFKAHLTKFMSEEYVFGPVDIKKLREKGIIEHITKDSILDSDFAFLDEFFDASDVLLRTLLGVLNEREWHRGMQHVTAKLHTAIVTSNYQRENEVTQAILDRFLFKAEVGQITHRNQRILMLSNSLKDNSQLKTIFDLDKIKEISDMIDRPNDIIVDKDIIDAFDELTEEYIKETKKYISDRTKVKSMKLLKCVAVLDKRKEVSYEDLSELKYIYCVLNKKLEEDLFDACYDKVISKKLEEKQVIEDLKQVESVLDKLPDDFTKFTDKEFIETMKQLNEYITLLDSMNKVPTNYVASTRDLLIKKVEKLISKNCDKFFELKPKNNKQDAK